MNEAPPAASRLRRLVEARGVVGRTALLNLAAGLVAIAFSLAVASVVFVISGNSPIAAYSDMFEFGSRLESWISTVNRATPLYLSGVAVAIGFKMNLFNIGVEGQYRLAALLAAVVGGALSLPIPLHIGLIFVVAMGTGAIWAGIAAFLKTTRGVHEVISTIMLNFIAGSFLVAFGLRVFGTVRQGNLRTDEIAESGRFPSLNPLIELFFREPTGAASMHSFALVAVAVGILYYLFVFRTRPGYDLRVTGVNSLAAQAGGVAPRRMIMQAMLLSGAVAGLVGLPELLNFSHEFSFDSTTELGFDGIAVALLGRNHPVGIAIGALVFGWLDRAGQILDLQGISPSIIEIVKGVIILSAVIAYEVVTRYREAQQTRAAAAATAGLELEAAAP
ncbi:MAG TPA: ABC transporter permease [Acidimicrobiales bacterium]|jgi:simple sugar transport system permease protein|nr:ABC transporter permease [Acidimicrobiales bacterium]